MDFLRPPCWRDGQPCPNACAAAQHDRIVYAKTALHGPWLGWRLSGQRLISPNREWIAPHLLDRMLWRHARLFDDVKAG